MLTATVAGTARVKVTNYLLGHYPNDNSGSATLLLR